MDRAIEAKSATPTCGTILFTMSGNDGGGAVARNQSGSVRKAGQTGNRAKKNLQWFATLRKQVRHIKIKFEQGMGLRVHCALCVRVR